jgi:hypothetical protein
MISALNYMRVYELSLKSENFSDLRISVSGLYLLAAPSTPPEAVDKVIERAKSGECQAHAEIKGKIDEIKRAKATAAGIKPQPGSFNGPGAPSQMGAAVLKQVGGRRHESALSRRPAQQRGRKTLLVRRIDRPL